MKKLLFILLILFAVMVCASAALWYGNTTTYSRLGNRGEQTKNVEQENTVVFLAVGDIMLSRNVAGAAAKRNDPLLPFNNLVSLLKSTDFNFANLESPFSGSDAFNPTGSLVFNAPRNMIQGLVAYNFRLLNFANNHSLDQGEDGLTYTNRYLTENGITTIGTGQTLAEAWEGKVITVRGVRVGFVGASYASVNDGGKEANNFVARIEDTERLKASIARLKTESDFIVATMHAGTEYVRDPNQGQIDFAHAAIDAGADMVIGAHPHWIQTTERYNGKWIFYSLGNFIFDQEWSQDTKEGLTLKIQISNTQFPNGTKKTTLKQIELIPVIVENYCCPRLANEIESSRILEKIGITKKILTGP